MDIVLLVLAIIAVVLLGTIIVILLKKKDTNHNDILLKDIASLNTQIELLRSQIKEGNSQIQGDFAKDLTSFKELFSAQIRTMFESFKVESSKASHEASDSTSTKFLEFQKMMVESLDTKFKTLTDKVDAQLVEINRKVEEKLLETSKSTNTTLASLIERLQKIDDAQRNLEGLQDNVVSLKAVLEGNQTRGQYGEYQLESILHSVFGDVVGCYEMQYTIKKARDGNDVRADAVVFTKGMDEFICIDSKFPFSHYASMFEAATEEEKESARKQFVADVKKHITDISNKYIIPARSATQALMFIPNDGLFAYIHHDCHEVVEYAMSKNVIITSPATIQAILATLNMLRINYERNKNLAEITKSLAKLSKDFQLFADEWSKFSSSIDTVVRKKGDIEKRVTGINTRFSAIDNATAIEFNDAEE